MKLFKIKSVKVPAGLRVTFYRQEDYVEERMVTEVDVACLDKPFNLNLI